LLVRAGNKIAPRRSIDVPAGAGSAEQETNGRSINRRRLGFIHPVISATPASDAVVRGGPISGVMCG
jgi:hypothetical protein